MDNTSMPAPFSTFVMGLASAALIDLGLVEDPVSKTKRVNRDHARSHIELLAMLKEKTRGNLTEEEKALLEQALTDLRMQFARLPG